MAQSNQIAGSSPDSGNARLNRTLKLWNLIIIGIVIIQPTAPMGIYGVISNKAHGHVVTTILIAMVAMLFTAISYGRMARVYQYVYDVTPGPRLKGIVYAGGFESSAWISRNSVAHWQRISGFGFKWGHRALHDPENSQKIHITTFGGGVWHEKVTTKPAILDIATPEMEPYR